MAFLTRRKVLALSAGMSAFGFAGCRISLRSDEPPGAVPGGDENVEPYVVKGIVTYADGRPLAGAEVLADNTLASNSALKTLSGEDGRYRIEIPQTYQSTWQSRGYVSIEYHGEIYERELDVNNDPFSTNDGAVRDLVFKLSGPVTRAPGGPGHGGRVSFFPDLSTSGNYYDDPTIEVTLEPVGPLLDGSEGETITAFDDGSGISDVPTGQYEAFVRYHPDDGGPPVDCEVRPDRDAPWQHSAVGVMPVHAELDLRFQYRIVD